MKLILCLKWFFLFIDINNIDEKNIEIEDLFEYLTWNWSIKFLILKKLEIDSHNFFNIK